MNAPPSSRPRDYFATTRWTQVLASRGNGASGKQALSDLCAAYYAPVVAFLRRDDRSEDAARELAHEFFAQVLERQSLAGADPLRGRFRSYLLGALKNFVAGRHMRDARQKRGGHFIHEPLPTESDTAPFPAIADLAAESPDEAFDRQWALSLLAFALEHLKRECHESGISDQFELLKPWLTGESDSTQADAARRLHLSEGALRVAIHRLRRRFRQLIKSRISDTVREPGEIAEEMRHLIQALS